MVAKQKNKSRKILIIIVFAVLFVISVSLIVLCELFWEGCVVAEIAKIVSSNFASVFGIGAIWELLNIEKIVKDVSEDIKNAEDIKKSGITEYQDSFNSINWESELKNVNTLVAVFIFGAHWVQDNEKILKEIKHLTIILPDYKIDDVCHDISVKLNHREEEVENNKEKVRERLKESIGKFLQLGANIKLYNKLPSFSYYLFGSNLIASPYYNEPTYRGADLPVFKLMKNESKNSNNFYSICKRDLNNIKKVSRTLEESEKNELLNSCTNLLEI